MLLIIAHHYVVNSGLFAKMSENPLAVNSVFLYLFGAWGKVGINCFVLITGYFMCRSAATPKKFFKLFFEVEFYDITIYLIFLLTGYSSFSFSDLAKAVLPITIVADNFGGCFLLFYLLISFLNILVRNMTEKQHIGLLAVVTFTYIILATVPKISVTMNYVTWFCVLYFIASYIRLYPKAIYEKTGFWGWASLIVLVLSVASILACLWLGAYAYYFLIDCNKILAVVDGICWFMFFKNIKMKPIKFINAVAATTFGVLLIHDNSDIMRQWLWKDLLQNVQMYSSPWLYLHAIGCVLAIFVVCSAIDRIRIFLLEKPFLSAWNRLWNKVIGKIFPKEEKREMQQ